VAFVLYNDTWRSPGIPGLGPKFALPLAETGVTTEDVAAFIKIPAKPPPKRFSILSIEAEFTAVNGPLPENIGLVVVI